jgi:hypothetical protein
MAKTFTAPFVQAVNNSNCNITAATSAVSGDSVSTAVLLFTAGLEGSAITSITAIPRATVTATALYLFTTTGSDTTALKLIDSITMPAQTLSTTAGITISTFTNYTEDYPLRLKATEKLYVATGVAANIQVYARGMDY